MPITYDGTTNTITVTGGAETSPITFEDIYQASVNNGWGVVEKQGNRQYIFTAKLTVGDGTTETWLKDLQKQIVFHNVLTDHAQYYLRVRANAHFVIGEPFSTVERSGGNGCEIYNDSNYVGWIGCEEGDEGIVEMYGSTVRSDPYRGYSDELHHCNNGRFWHCLFNNVRFMYNFNVDVYNSTIVHNAYNGWISSTGYFNQVRAFYCDYGISFHFDYSATMRNVIVKHSRSGGDIDTWNLTVDCSLVDAECNWRFQWRQSSGKIHRKYSFNVIVQDKDGNKISDATVELYDKYGNLVFSDTTDPNGRLLGGTKEITYKIYQSADPSIITTETIETAYGPHTLVVSKAGYVEYRAVIDINTKMTEYIVVLSKEIRPSIGILNREQTITSGNTAKIRFASESGDTVRLYLYSPTGTELISGALMTETTAGIYEYEITFDELWGTGEFLVKCVDETKGVSDAISLTVIDESEKWATKSQADNISMQVNDVSEQIARHDRKMTAFKFT